MPTLEEQIDTLAAKVLAHPDFGGAVAALVARYVAWTGPQSLGYGSPEVAEDAENGTVVASPANDPGGTAPLTYSLTDDAGGRFAIDPDTGVITVADTDLIIYEVATSHTIEVVVSDANDLALGTTVPITILQSQETQPLIIDFVAEVLREGDANGTLAGTASVSGGVGSVTLSKQADPDGIFAFDAETGALTLSDSTTFETLLAADQTAFGATIRATDSDDPANVEDEEVSIAGVPTTYDPVANHFQSANEEYGTRTSALTGAVNDSDELVFSFWAHSDTDDGGQSVIHGVGPNGESFTARFLGSRQFRVIVAAAAGQLVNVSTAPLDDIATPDHWFFSCRDGVSSKEIVLERNGVDVLENTTTAVNGDIPLASIDSWGIAADDEGFVLFNGGLADLILAQKFVADSSAFFADDLLLNPGADGAVALGEAALLILGGPSFDAETPLADYSGNENDFTANGSLSVYLPAPNEEEEEPSGNVINAASLSKAHVTAAVDAATADGDIIQLLDGDAGYTTPLDISSPFKIHIRGADWLGSDAAYRDAFTALASLAEDVYAATLSGSGRAAAWAAYATARDAFQPTTTGLMFTLTGDDITLSRMEMDELTIQSVGWAVFHNRFTGSHSVDLESSHLGAGLLAQNILNRTTISITARVSANASQSFWDNIAVTPGGTDMPCIQDNHVHANHTEEGVDRTCMDPSWQGGKALARRNVLTGGAGRALVRFHGPYRSGANCNQTNSGRYLELLDTLCINDTDQSWQAIEWLGGDGIIDNFRNGYKNGTFRIGIEANARPPACNAQCAGLSSANLNLFPYTQRTAGPSNGGEGLYITNLFHKGSQITSMADAGTSKRCGNDLDDVIVEGTDYIFGARPNYTPLGTHPFETRIP
jgi:hypothetical protein